MVNPVTGPFTRSTSSASVRETRTWYRQKPPFTLPLNGSHRLVINTSWRNASGLGSGSLYPNTVPFSNGEINNLPSEYWYARNDVIREVFERLDQVDRASLGVALVQYAQAEKTLVTRGRQLLDFSIGLKNFDVRRMRRALRVNADLYEHKLPSMPRYTRALKKRSWQEVSADYGGAWLEWSWGISPTVSDIHNALGVLDSAPHLVVPLTETTRDGRDRMGITKTKRFVRNFPTSVPYSNSVRTDGRVFYKLTGQARITDPNRLMYTQLGLDEPLAIAFEVIPWSFLLGWVSNVETYLRNWSPIRDQYKWEGLCETGGYRATRVEFWNTYGATATWLMQSCTKSPLSSLPYTKFKFKPLRFKPLRAANAIALLSTFLRER